MKARGIVKKLRAARKAVDQVISDNRTMGGMYAHGMAAEGYHGGYCDALDDVMLALNGVTPKRNGWWSGDGGKRGETQGAEEGQK